MTRPVIQGTSRKLYRLQRRDLIDPDFTSSGWRYVDASGIDLRALTLFDLDVVDSVMDGSTLPTEPRKIKYLQSRGTSWDNVKMPPGLSSYKHDMVIVLMEKLLAEGIVGDSRRLVEIVHGYLTSDRSYLKSWPDSVAQVQQQTGWTLEKTLQVGRDSFAKFPRLIERVNAFAGESERVRPTPEIGQDPKAFPVIGPDSNFTIDITGDLRNQWHRQQVNAAVGRRAGPDYFVHFFALTPLWGVAVHKSRVYTPEGQLWWTSLNVGDRI